MVDPHREGEPPLVGEKVGAPRPSPPTAQSPDPVNQVRAFSQTEPSNAVDSLRAVEGHRHPFFEGRPTGRLFV